MGLLSRFKRAPSAPLKLPEGSFTVDSGGAVLVSTLPSSFPNELIHDIGARVRKAFAEAADAQLPLNELVVHYPGLKISARELRGGALIFLTPKKTRHPAKLT